MSKKYKLEGAAFEEVKAKVRSLKEAKEKFHEELWEAIYKNIPELNRDEVHSIDRNHEDIGIYIVEREDSVNPLKEILKVIVDRHEDKTKEAA